MRPLFRFMVSGVLFLSCQTLSHASHSGDSLADHIHGELAFLADDALRGRGSGSADELVAALYVASQLRDIGVQPGGDLGGYIQDVVVELTLDNGPKQWHTRNVIGVIPGRDKKR